MRAFAGLMAITGAVTSLLGIWDVSAVCWATCSLILMTLEYINERDDDD